jgi:hypothetical protein
LFLTTVPNRRQDDKAWLASGLEDTEECSHDDKACKVFAGGMTSQAGSPGNDAEGEVFCNGDSGDEPVLRVLDDEDGEVDTGCKP